jgi:probable rRNA maturation factor
MPISVKTPGSLARLAAPLKALVRGTIEQEGGRAGEIAVSLADDALLRELNRTWRGIDRATDVLSFAYHERAGDAIDGDIVISLERVEQQAKRFRVTRGSELARLAVHGALHLAGLDHHRALDRRRMRAREERAMRAGRGNVRVMERLLARGVRV